MLRDGAPPPTFRKPPPPAVPMPISHFLVRPRRRAAEKTNATIDASVRELAGVSRLGIIKKSRSEPPAAPAPFDMRSVPVVGMRIEGLFEAEKRARKQKAKAGTWYPGTIVKVYENGTFDVDYDDGDLEDGLTWSDVLRPF